MGWVSPVEWFAWIYGKLFQNHIYIGGAIVMLIFAFGGLALWSRGVDKYREDHAPKPEAVASVSSTPPDTAANPAEAVTPPKVVIKTKIHIPAQAVATVPNKVQPPTVEPATHGVKDVTVDGVRAEGANGFGVQHVIWNGGKVDHVTYEDVHDCTGKAKDVIANNGDVNDAKYNNVGSGDCGPAGIPVPASAETPLTTTVPASEEDNKSPK